MLATKIDRGVNQAHRRTLRALPRHLLEEAYRQLRNGYSEGFVCNALGIDFDLMEGALMPAIREALWERGYFGLDS